jgi:hypothetical protein
MFINAIPEVYVICCRSPPSSPTGRLQVQLEIRSKENECGVSCASEHSHRTALVPAKQRHGIFQPRNHQKETQEGFDPAPIEPISIAGELVLL